MKYTKALLREKAKDMDRTRILGKWQELLLSIPRKTLPEYGTITASVNALPDGGNVPIVPPSTPAQSRTSFAMPAGWTDSNIGHYSSDDFKSVEVEECRKTFVPATIMDAYFVLKETESQISLLDEVCDESIADSEEADDERSDGVYCEEYSDEDAYSEEADSYEDNDSPLLISHGDLFLEGGILSIEAGDRVYFNFDSDLSEISSEEPSPSTANPEDQESVLSAEPEHGFSTTFPRRRGTVLATIPHRFLSTSTAEVAEPTPENGGDYDRQSFEERPFFTNPWNNDGATYLGFTAATDLSLQIEPIPARMAEEHDYFFRHARGRAAIVRATEDISPLDRRPSVDNHEYLPPLSPVQVGFARPRVGSLSTLIRAEVARMASAEEGKENENDGIATSASPAGEEKYECRRLGDHEYPLRPYVPFAQ
ncbi:hypothetical protein V5O48_001971 [Marasmius crinis-equi]|uniref:Uncharacterized protein n=1 Tax=Marasmius crinis-equi TaxID=585013 RepID=A0ABR3FX08_9AGAR